MCAESGGCDLRGWILVLACGCVLWRELLRITVRGTLIASRSALSKGLTLQNDHLSGGCDLRAQMGIFPREGLSWLILAAPASTPMVRILTVIMLALGIASRSATIIRSYS